MGLIAEKRSPGIERIQGVIDPRSGGVTQGEDPFFTGLSDELADKGFLVTTADDLITWARTGSLMWMTFGLACCAIEMMQASMPNRASIVRALMPETWIEDLWSVLRFSVDTDRLTADSDPEHALLEPLQCYGGLDADGMPRPDGIDIDFFCQCYLPHDPACPPGMVQKNKLRG